MLTAPTSAGKNISVKLTNISGARLRRASANPKRLSTAIKEKTLIITVEQRRVLRQYQHAAGTEAHHHGNRGR